MKLPQSIIDDIGHATDVATRDTSPGWLMGAASFFRSIADDIDKAAEREKARIEAAKEATKESK